MGGGRHGDVVGGGGGDDDAGDVGGWGQHQLDVAVLTVNLRCSYSSRELPMLGDVDVPGTQNEWIIGLCIDCGKF